MRIKSTTLIFLTIIIFSIFSCQNLNKNKEKVDIYTSIAPIKFIIDNITGEILNTATLIKPGSDPHTFEISAKELQLLANAKAYFSIDLPYEKTIVDKMTKQNISSFKVFSIELNEGKDIHRWTSISKIKEISKEFVKALTELYPDKKNLFDTNYNVFIDKLNNLNEAIKYNIENSKIKTFLILHPALTYFAEDYGLNQISIEKEGKEPSLSDLIELGKRIKKDNIKFIFLQPEFPEEQILQFIKDNKIEAINIDILGYNIFETLLKVSETFLNYSN